MSSPRGKEDVRSALIEAAAELYAHEAAPSVRAIAARAGVNHGLVHRHFGDKEGLRRATMEALSEAIAADMPDAEEATALSFDELLARAFFATKKHERFLRVLLRAYLDGEIPPVLSRTFPVVQSLITAGEARGVDGARELVAERVAAGLGWLLFEPFIRQAAGLGDGEPAFLSELDIDG